MLAEIIRDAPKCTPLEAKELLSKMYETRYGIYNHALAKMPGRQRPLASVAMHDAEDNGKSTRLYNFIGAFFDEGIHKHTGLNLGEFMQMPREITELIREKCSKISENTSKAERGILNDMANAAKPVKR